MPFPVFVATFAAVAASRLKMPVFSWRLCG
jgi:hypothetical protein